tara:strand:- start:432 stop:617 length:186 start_codon:yes stop_codon:yes gene_type:complete
MGNKTSSPKGGKRGCLCKNGKYSSRCCNGELSEQGIGTTLEQGSATVTNNENVRVMIRING